MPKAAVDEHDRLESREDDVRFARQILAMEREPVAGSMSSAADL
jgi:hypothetical protein